MARTTKKVTASKADRAMTAMIEIMECADFGEYSRKSSGDLSSALNRACDLLREVRADAPSHPATRRKW